MASLTLLMASTASHGELTAKQPLTVADAIETTRFMQSARGAEADPRSDGVFVSPDRHRYAVMLIRGDLKRAEGAGNWVEILVGRLDSLDGAKPRLVARLFTQSWGTSDPVFGVPAVTWPRQNPLVWLPDNERVAFFWPDDKDVVQVAAVNVSTGELAYLTHEPANVVSFELTPTGEVLYSALIPHSRERSEQLLREGFTVGDSDLIDIVRGDVGGYGAFDRSNNTNWFIAGPGGSPPRRRYSAGTTDRSAPQFRTVFSADGRYALMGHYPAEVPLEWSRYTERAITLRMAAYKVSPNAIQARYLKQLFVLDLQGEQMRPLWSAPMASRAQGAWSPDGRTVLVGPALLPLDGADEDGLAGHAIAEVDVASGKYSQLKLPADSAGKPLQSLRWLDKDSVEVIQQASTFRFRREAAGWKLTQVALTEAARPRETEAGVRVEWRQDSATPPVLYAVAGKRTRVVLDPNPDLLKRFQLGRVEFVTWRDKRGREWHGRLYHPVREVRGARVPLVIQTHGFAPPGEFSLYGNGGSATEPGLGPGYSVYAAQPLASKGIAVLQMEDLPPALAQLTVTPEEPEAYMTAYEGAVESLASRGLVDPARVGIVGFSRTGWHVAYALTHSAFPFAAAIVTDSFGGDYIGAALSDWNAEISRNVGAEPFGEGLRTWLERTPAFNVEKLKTPLRIQLESGGLPAVIGKWELFSRARYLKKPVELYVIPDIERGSHGIQNPLQCLAAQQGAVTWFESWLLHGRAPGSPAGTPAPTPPPTPARP
jgi:dienelactone hydrolase